MRALEWSQHYTLILQRAENSGVSCAIWPKCERVQAFMHVIITCKDEDDSIKYELKIIVMTVSVKETNTPYLGTRI